MDKQGSLPEQQAQRSDYFVPFDRFPTAENQHRPGCIIAASIMMAMITSIPSFLIILVLLFALITLDEKSFAIVADAFVQAPFQSSTVLIVLLLSITITSLSIRIRSKPINIKLINTLAMVWFIVFIMAIFSFGLLFV